MKEYKVFHTIIEGHEEAYLNKHAEEGWILKSTYVKKVKNPIDGVVHEYVYFVLEKDK